MNASIAASAVRIPGRDRCTVASTTASNGANPSFSFWRIWPIRMSVLRMRMPESAIRPTSALMPNGCWNTSKVGMTPMRPSGAVANTIVITDIERTWTMIVISVRAIMIALTLITIIVQVRSISVMTMVFATAPLGLIGVIPTLLVFQQPFGINALVGLVALSGILMRNTLILIGQIRQNEKDGLAPFDAVVEATVQRSRPVILTALAAMLAFIPLTQSVFWGTLAYTLIGGTFGGTVLTLVFLPALYAIWFKIKPVVNNRQPVPVTPLAPVKGEREHSLAGGAIS